MPLFLNGFIERILQIFLSTHKQSFFPAE